MFKPVSKKNAKILDKIFDGLKEGEAKRINNSTAYMYLSAEHLYANTYSMAHYFEMNGDLCPDPDMELLKDANGNWYPVAMQQSFGQYTRAVMEYDESGVPTKVNLARYSMLRDFLNMWINNLKEQQGL